MWRLTASSTYLPLILLHYWRAYFARTDKQYDYYYYPFSHIFYALTLYMIRSS